MKTEIKLLDIIKQNHTMETIRKQELHSTEDFETLHTLYLSYNVVVKETFAIDCEILYSEFYYMVLQRFERNC